MSTKYQKFLSTNDNHDENNILVSSECISRPLPEFSQPFSSAPMNNNHAMNRPKPFPLFKQLHENFCKFTPHHSLDLFFNIPIHLQLQISIHLHLPVFHCVRSEREWTVTSSTPHFQSSIIMDLRSFLIQHDGILIINNKHLLKSQYQ